MASLAALYHGGNLIRAEFVSQALDEIRTHAHTAAGIGAAQLDGEYDPDVLDELVDGQEDYLDGFGADIAGGDLSEDAIRARGHLYGGVVWTAFQLGKLLAAPDETWDWALDESAEHCDDPDGQDCPSFAEGGPYTADSLPARPGDGTTPCGGRCRCDLDPHGNGDDAEEGDA